MRCICCDTPLQSFDDPDMCKVCIKASEDDTTKYRDPQHALITDKEFRVKYSPHKPLRWVTKLYNKVLDFSENCGIILV